MLNHAAKYFRIFLEVMLWINLVGGAIFGGITCSRMMESKEAGWLLGILVGLMLGEFSNVVFGGLVAIFLNIGTDIKDIAEKQRKEDKDTSNNGHYRKERLKKRVETSEFFTDPRDGQKYRIVKIGNKMWMAENLNYETDNSWYYNNNEADYGRYGRLYDWDTARNVCPVGWRLPSRQDWNDLVKEVGESSLAGVALKAESPDWNGTDEFGFSALPGGYRNAGGSFGSVGRLGYWWTATEDGGSNAYLRYVGFNYEYVYEDSYNKKEYGFSVRCLRS